jgi:hypothetical protein
VTGSTPADSSPHVLITTPIGVASGQEVDIEIVWTARDTVSAASNAGGRSAASFRNNAGTAVLQGPTTGVGQHVWSSGGAITCELGVSAGNYTIIATGSGNVMNWTFYVYTYPGTV